MIIKKYPEDFYVKEVLELPKNTGNFAWYLMWKRNLSTIRAIKIIRNKLGISKKRISFAGEKDKKAVTEQYISIKNFEGKDFYDFKNVKLKYIGHFDQPVSTDLLKGNEFRIVVREISKEERKNFYENIDLVKKYGMPNYFDEQRFGDIRAINHLIGKAILKGNLEEAAKILLTYTSEKENPKATEARKWLKENWGKFREALRKFPKWLDVELAVLNYLVHHPKDYANALRKLHKKLLLLFVHSYQSHIFNKALSEIIKKTSEYREIEFSFGKLAFPKKWLNYDLIKDLELPIIGFKTNLNEYPGFIKEIYEKILKEEGISLEDFKVKKLPELSCSGDKRKAIVKPENLKYEEDEDVILYFFLPKGSYATILIKYLFLI